VVVKMDRDPLWKKVGHVDGVGPWVDRDTEWAGADLLLAPGRAAAASNRGVAAFPVHDGHLGAVEDGGVEDAGAGVEDD
jgi:hypothetical protein